MPRGNNRRGARRGVKVYDPRNHHVLPCTRKQWYDTQEAAQEAMRLAVARAAPGAQVPRSVYACRICPAWHLTGELR